MDDPQAVEIPAPPPANSGSESSATPADDSSPALSPLVLEERADGSIVIDLTALAPAPQRCVEEEPDPFNPTIMVCRKTGPDPRLGKAYGPSDEELFGSAIPRARIKLSDSASAEANAIKKGVGGIDADGGEVRVKIDF